jgi:hypothetical protein
MNRFAKIFWPKEVSKLVDKYRDEGSLNQKAHDYLETVPLKNFYLFFFLTIVSILISEPKIGIFLILFSPIFVWIDLRFLFKRQIATYHYGYRKKVKVAKVSTGLIYNSKRMVFFDENKEKYIVKSGGGPLNPNRKLPKEGDVVEINFDPNKKYGATLNMTHLREYYSLTTKPN